jgi:hypothetical protein
VCILSVDVSSQGVKDVMARIALFCADTISGVYIRLFRQFTPGPGETFANSL